MTSLIAPSLGILGLERKQPPNSSPPEPKVGSLTSAGTYGFPVIVETVEGAWSDRVIRGDPSLEPACIAAARRLEKRGAVAISANCGFFMRHQSAVAASVSVPVVTSSLLLVPMLLRQLPEFAKLAVVTADSRHCGDDLLGLDARANCSRVVIGGIEDGPWFQNLMKDWSEDGTELPVPNYWSYLEKDVAACATRLRAAHPQTAAFLFECTGFPLVTPAIRRMTGVPIYDITTLCKMTLASVS
ncbi:hypothetical protein ABIF97_004243 [Bradyrhizobium japonicum]